MPTILCPKCHQEYEVEENAIGAKAKCENCNTEFIIQESSQKNLTEEMENRKQTEISQNNNANFSTRLLNLCKHTVMQMFAPGNKKRVVLIISLVVITIFIVILIVISFGAESGKEKPKSQSALPAWRQALINEHNAKKTMTDNSKQNDPTKKIITSIAGVSFGSSPRGTVKVKSEKIAGAIETYAPCETIKTDSSLFRELTVYYTPITRQLFYIECSVFYDDLSKIADLFNEKYGTKIEFESHSSTIQARKHIYKQGYANIGDVQVVINGERVTDATGTYHYDYDRKGEVIIENKPLLDLFLTEYKQTQKYIEYEKEKAEREATERKQYLEKLKLESEKHKRELDDI